MLKLENISKTFNKGTINEKVIFHNFNLSIKRGEFIIVIGSNGSGKSTLLNLIAGKIKPDKGNVIIDGIEVSKEPEYIRAKQISRVFQDPLMGTSSDMKIYENLALASKKGNKLGLRRCISKCDFNSYKEILKPLSLGLEDHLSSKVGLLSGGQRQALTLLMATIKSPQILLLDEHTSALDPKTAQTILDQTKSIIKKDKITTLMITHSMKDAIKLGTRLIMLSNGKIIFDVSGKEKNNLTAEILLQKFSQANY